MQPQTSFTASTKGVAYQNLRRPFFISSKKLNAAKNAFVDINQVNTTLNLNYNIIVNTNTNDIPSPIVTFIVKGHDVMMNTLLDSGSLGPKRDITSYIARSSVSKIPLSARNIKCSCTNEQTCTPVGCISTSECIELNDIQLQKDNEQMTIANIKLRIIDTLRDNVDVLIGFNDLKTNSVVESFKCLFSEFPPASSEEILNGYGVDTDDSRRGTHQDSRRSLLSILSSASQLRSLSENPTEPLLSTVGPE